MNTGWNPLEPTPEQRRILHEQDTADINRRNLEAARLESPSSGVIPLFLIVACFLVDYLDHHMPFWGRCLVAAGAGLVAAWWAGNMFEGCVVVRVIAFIAVAFLLFAVFKDEYGMGQTVMKDYVLAFLGLVVIGIIFACFKGWFGALRGNPVQTGCLTLVVGWVIYILFIYQGGYTRQVEMKQAAQLRQSSAHRMISKQHHKRTRIAHVQHIPSASQ